MDADGCVELEGQALAAADGVDIMYGPICGWSGAFERDLTAAHSATVPLVTRMVLLDQDFVGAVLDPDVGQFAIAAPHKWRCW